jgi:hypothetical protein
VGLQISRALDKRVLPFAGNKDAYRGAGQVVLLNQVRELAGECRRGVGRE